MSQAVNFTTPVGRLVAGSIYKAGDKDAEGRPLTVKHGPNAGQPRVDYYFGIAIPKGAEAHWNQTEWGKVIWGVGTASNPTAGTNPKFAWKVKDGDSTAPDAKGKLFCDRVGHKGHWIIGFSGGYQPKCYSLISSDTPVELTEPNAIPLGHWVQVNGNVKGNGSMQKPGVFMNHSMVCLVGYGQVISVGPDAASAGFGASPLPAGVSTTPQAGFTPPAAATPPQMPAPSASYRMPPAAPAPRKVMLEAAGGYSYEEMIRGGWNDQQLIDNHMMRIEA